MALPWSWFSTLSAVSNENYPDSYILTCYTLLHFIYPLLHVGVWKWGVPQNHPFSIRIFHCKIKNHPAIGVPPSKTHSKSSLTKPLKIYHQSTRKSHVSSLIHGKLPPFFHPLKIDEQNTRSSRSSRYHPHRSSRRAAVNPPGHRCKLVESCHRFLQRAQKKKRAGKCAWFTMVYNIYI